MACRQQQPHTQPESGGEIERILQESRQRSDCIVNWQKIKSSVTLTYNGQAATYANTGR